MAIYHGKVKVASNGSEIDAEIFNKTYPIGTVYITVTNSSSCPIIQGTWEKITTLSSDSIFYWKRIA